MLRAEKGQEQHNRGVMSNYLLYGSFLDIDPLGDKFDKIDLDLPYPESY
ncbi:hypothetical protein [Moorena sp. SIO4G3]|nr:hypothetical protein [Moorena sp. SIO4G3]NEO77315.1 hypothetical protein [Moorena sp. SIO4G3]